MRASLLVGEGHLERATEELRLSLALVPAQSLAHALLGELRYRLGEYDDAIAAWSTVRRALAPTVGDVSAGEVGTGEVAAGDLYVRPERQAYTIGCAHLALGRLEAAATSFDEGLRACPSDAGCTLGLAHVARLRGRFEESRQLAEESASRDPGWSEPPRLLALLDGDERLDARDDVSR